MSHNEEDRKEILIVDDDPDILELLCTLLRDSGYTAVGASDANAAVARVDDHVPDLLLIDYMMAETDGMMTLQRCRAEPGVKHVPAAMLTADSRLVTLERALAVGFDEFLPKPILDHAEFLQRINDVITRGHNSSRSVI